MSAERVVVTTNGPGELMGWTRPFLRAVLARAPDADVTIVLVPCPYATGREAAQAKTMFPNAHVLDPKAYARFLVNKRVEGMHRGSGVLQYLGGDLFHATTLAKRLGLAPLTYKFSRRAYSPSFKRFYALDEENARKLRADGAPADRVRIVGNLVADSVLGTLEQELSPPGVGQGVCILPGSRPAEIKYLMQFFLAAARDLSRRMPGVPVTFVVSPFNSDEQLSDALARRPDAKYGGIQGRLTAGGTAIEGDGVRVALDRSGDYGALSRAQLVITIPGTKCLEAAVLGRPMLVLVPLNRPEEITLNGLGAYLHHVPFVGRPLKRWLVRNVERSFQFVAQPNIDVGREVAPEMRGVMMPADVVDRACDLLARPGDLREMGETLSKVYASHAGAADRMAADALSVVTRDAKLAGTG
jgi:lipid-A-disaccharide synthase